MKINIIDKYIHTKVMSENTVHYLATIQSLHTLLLKSLKVTSMYWLVYNAILPVHKVSSLLCLCLVNCFDTMFAHAVFTFNCF